MSAGHILEHQSNSALVSHDENSNLQSQKGADGRGGFSLTPSESFLRKSFPFSCFWQKIQLRKEQISLKRKPWQQETVRRTGVCVVLGVQASRACQVTQHSSAKCLLLIPNLLPLSLTSVRKNGSVCYTVGKHRPALSHTAKEASLSRSHSLLFTNIHNIRGNPLRMIQETMSGFFPLIATAIFSQVNC